MTKPNERSYETGRAVSDVLAGLGLLIVGLGLVVVVWGFATGGLMGSVQALRGAEPTFLDRTISAIPGLMIVLSGVVCVTISTIAVAVMDSSEMQREMLQIAQDSHKRTFGSDEVGQECDEAGPGKIGSRINPGPIDAQVEFPSTAFRITTAEMLSDGRVTVVFDNGEPVIYANIDEARRFLW